eukprot:s675_g37.t1
MSAKTPHCADQSEHSSSPLSIFAGGWHSSHAGEVCLLMAHVLLWSEQLQAFSVLIGRLRAKWPKDVLKKCCVHDAASRAPLFVQALLQRFQTFSPKSLAGKVD